MWQVFWLLTGQFWPLVPMGLWIRMPRFKNWERLHLSLIAKISIKPLAFVWPSGCKFKLQKRLFSPVIDAIILTPCSNGTVHVSVIRKELKKKTFVLYCQNINIAVGIQLIYTLWVKLQKGLFLAKYDYFF